MKKYIFFRIVLGFLLLLLWNCKQSNENKDIVDKTDPKDVREIINKKNRQIEVWMKEGNIDSAATIFADNVIQMPPHQEPMEGMDQFKKTWKENLGYGKWDFKIKIKEVKVCGEMAAERGEYTLNFTPNENAPMPAFKDEGNYVVLWENIDGNWKIVWDAPVSKVSMSDSIPRENMEKQKMTYSNTSRSRVNHNKTRSESESGLSRK